MQLLQEAYILRCRVCTYGPIGVFHGYELLDPIQLIRVIQSVADGMLMEELVRQWTNRTTRGVSQPKTKKPASASPGTNST